MHRRREEQGKRHQHNEAGISLIEVLLAVAIFTLSVASLGGIGLGGMAATADALMRFRATLAVEEASAALRSIRDRDYGLLVPGTYGLSFAGGEWSLAPTPDMDDVFLRTITLAAVAPGKTRANIDVSWTRGGRTASVAATFFLHRLRGTSWIQTTAADFLSGRQNGVVVEHGVGDGAVALELRNEWAKPDEFISVDVVGTGEVTAMAEDGGVLYAALWGPSGTTIEAIDIADAGNNTLTPLVRVQLPERVYALAANGPYLYLATDGTASELVALSRGDLSRVQTVNLPGTARLLTLVATGTSLYAGRALSGSPELYEFSIAAPESGIPVVRSTNIDGSIAAIVLQGQYVILGTTANAGEITVRRIGDFGAASTLDLSGGADVTALASDGSALFVARRSSGTHEIVHVDLADPSAPAILGGLDIAGNATDIAFAPDGRLYAASDRPNQELIVVTPATLTQTVYDISTGAGAMKLVIAGPYAYAGLQNVNPEIVALRGGQGNWATPRLAGGADIAGGADARAIFMGAAALWLGTEERNGNELLAFELADPLVPRLIGGIELNADINDIVGAGNLLFLATSNNAGELRVINSANPALPVLLGTFNAPGNQDGFSVAASGTLVALGTANNTSGTGREIMLLSVANPSTPLLGGSAETGGHVRGLAFTRSGFLVAATGNDAKEVIVFDPRTPTLTEIASFNLPGTADATRVYVEDNTLIVTTRSGGANPDVYIFSINPESGGLALRGSLALGGDPSDVTVLNTLAFVVTDTGGPGLTVIDITNPANPRQLSTLSLGDNATAIAQSLGRAYVATALNTREIAIVEPSPPSTEYVHRGWLRSSSFDSGNPLTTWGPISWTFSGGTGVKLQIRTSSTEAGLDRALWTGAGGVPGGYFLTPGETIVPYAGADGTRWIEYRAELAGDGATRPVLEDVTITYN